MGGLEHVHCAAVAQNMRRHLLCGDGRQGDRGDVGVLGEDILEPRAGHRSAGTVEEQRHVQAVRPDCEPGFDCVRRFPPQRQNPLAPAFAYDVDIGRRPGVELINREPDQFGYPPLKPARISDPGTTRIAT